MTSTRLFIVMALVAILVMLLGWQRHREGLMTTCLERGQFWNGPTSTCEPTPYAPILKRALERS